MLSDEVKALASGRNFATLTTLLPDGRPATQVMWVAHDDECIVMNTEVHRRKYTNLQRDPRATVCLWQWDDPYRYAEVRGELVETIHGQRARDHIDELAERYFGRPYDPSTIVSERVILRIRPVTT